MKTQITFVLDSSGSMAAIEEDTIGGFNTFLQEQRTEPGKATVTLYEFNTNVERRYHGYPIEDAPGLDKETYSPGGRTALHDAISTAVSKTEDYIREKKSHERPETVIIVILTDGKENASETPQERVREQVKACRKERNWEFLFIGANQNAALTASEMGIAEDRSLDMAHSGEGAKAAYESTSKRVSEARRHGSTNGFSEDDRRRQDDAESR